MDRNQPRSPEFKPSAEMQRLAGSRLSEMLAADTAMDVAAKMYGPAWAAQDAAANAARQAVNSLAPKPAAEVPEAHPATGIDPARVRNELVAIYESSQGDRRAAA